MTRPCHSTVRRGALFTADRKLAGSLKSGPIAEDDDIIAGYSLGLIKNEIPIFQMKRYGYISDLYVKREFRGRGLSTKLMDSMLAWFRDKGLEYASIGFYADNNEARDIYRKWGFFDYKIEARKKI